MWTQTTEGNKTIFMPGAGDAHPGLVRLIYDPDAPSDARVKADLSYFFDVDETVSTIQAKLGL